LDTREPTVETPAYDRGDRIRLWFLFGGFGAVLALALEQLFARTGNDLPILAWLVGALAAFSLGALAEIGINIRNKLEQHFPTERWTQKLLKGDS
jgi:hypothetical protein